MQYEGDELILASGYASSGLFYKKNINDFVDNINIGFKNATNPKIIIIGGMFEHTYLDDSCNPPKYVSVEDTSKFQDFIYELNNHFANTNVTVEVYRAKTNHWHSKIAIKRKSKSDPIACIVGSSNLTIPAFSVNWKGYNNETDVFIFANGFKGIRNIRYKIQELIDARENLVNEFVLILKEKRINFNEDNIRIVCSSSKGFPLIQDAAVKKLFIGESEENNHALDIVFMLNEYNELIEASGNKKYVIGSAVISVRTTQIRETKILEQINNRLNNALVSYADKKSGLTL
ncbi:hypothetical protein LGL08_00130 [Clostridium estertheticum]|uniref:hypothetical protein n=1 Tax=Clostridium estertheticum TaxID=238834 RepID=UPI001CF41344|nr:hypothetical protein [Clostridium estertheticum]MCB2305621.1 hypothetical protein [Clostridium estertheticum]MCB2344563.1 hypothetical protein [Clostridium estertheticum]MCB2347977.1 hypothetical protein [Clostridium estertheticum]WAG45621.1 hypothetical protein LL127_19210 [Clostridium estertheticum]